MAEYDEDEDGDELPSVDHGSLNEGPWEKTKWLCLSQIAKIKTVKVISFLEL